MILHSASDPAFKFSNCKVEWIMSLLGDNAVTFQWHSLATNKQFCDDTKWIHAEDDTKVSCGRPAKTMSEPGNLTRNGSEVEPD